MLEKGKMLEEFTKSYEDLERHMCAVEANKEDMDTWFYPTIRELVDEYGEEIAVQYGQNSHSDRSSSIEYLVKAGVKSFDKDFLLKLTKNSDEDEVYDAALCLALCGHDEGYDILRAYAMQEHPLYTGWITVDDIIEDLEYAEDERASNLVADIKEQYADMFSMRNPSEVLALLKEHIGASNNPDADFIIRHAKYELFWVVKPRSYDDYGTGLGSWMINRHSKEIEALSSQVDPDIWSEIYQESQDSEFCKSLRFDAADKKSLINLKNLLGIPLSEARLLAERPHWFGGHKFQLEYIREKLMGAGIETTVGYFRFDGSIRKLRAFPYEGYFIEDIIKFIKNEPSPFWEG